MHRIKLPVKNMSFWVAVILSLAAAISVMIALYQVYLPVKVLAANKDIPAGVVIGQGDIGYVTMSRRDKHELALTDPGQVIGKYTKENLYTLEPILSKKITSDLSGDAKNYVGPDETVITLKQIEARWPQTIKDGDTVTAVAILEGGNPQVVGREIKVLSATNNANKMIGTVEQIKNSVSTNTDNSITLSLKWDQVGPLMFGKALSKELWLLPEQAGADLTGDIYNAGQMNSLRQLLSYGKDNRQPIKNR
ncbi:MAG: SAF domain-containing protein [Desulfocucumaceae bacterium]